MSDTPTPDAHWSRKLIGLALAVLVVGACIVALYWVGYQVLPMLPPWAKALAAILGAALFLLSPFTAARVYRHATQTKPEKSP